MRRGPALIENGRVNPGYLKLDLLCKGLRIAEDCRLDDRHPLLRVRAGLGSGLEMVLPRSGGMRVNAPVLESFARESPFTLHGPVDGGRFALRHEDRPLAQVAVPATPAFYGRRTSTGKPMVEVGAIQGTYLGVYYGGLCANWEGDATGSCRFCSVGDNLRAGHDRADKTPEDVVETARAAREELGITFVHLNGGFDASGRYLERFGPVLRALGERTGLLLGLQIPPLHDLEEYRAVRRLGVNNVSLCFELWDPARFAQVCPGKSRRASLDRYREAIRYCAEQVRFETTNGELIAGLEDPGQSMAAVDWLTGVGAVPTICVFRPVPGTPLAEAPPPRVEEMVQVFAHAYRRCMERGLPIGVAPGVRVSIVMTPDEGRWLLPPGERSAFPWRRLRLAALRGAFALHHRLRRGRGEARARPERSP